MFVIQNAQKQVLCSGIKTPTFTHYWASRDAAEIEGMLSYPRAEHALQDIQQGLAAYVPASRDVRQRFPDMSSACVVPE